MAPDSGNEKCRADDREKYYAVDDAKAAREMTVREYAEKNILNGARIDQRKDMETEVLALKELKCQITGAEKRIAEIERMDDEEIIRAYALCRPLEPSALLRKASPFDPG